MTGDECKCSNCTTLDEKATAELRQVFAPSIVPFEPLPRPVVAFTGLAGSGKSTAAQYLVETQGFTRVRFAGPLKDMMRALGLTEREIEGDLKEESCALLGGKTPRFAMQTIGTEWGRDLIDGDLWIRAWRAAVDALPEGEPVVCDDCRFPNEAEAIKAIGGAIVRVERRGAGGGASGHVSETYQIPALVTIDNNTSIADFRTRVDATWRTLSWALAAGADAVPHR
jgi:hypothetical protein